MMPSTQRVLYHYVKCGRVFERERLVKGAGIRCPFCGFPALKKSRPPTAKLISTPKLTEEQRLLE